LVGYRAHTCKEFVEAICNLFIVINPFPIYIEPGAGNGRLVIALVYDALDKIKSFSYVIFVGLKL
jgi:hypothetical protein